MEGPEISAADPGDACQDGLLATLAKTGFRRQSFPDEALLSRQSRRQRLALNFEQLRGQAVGKHQRLIHPILRCRGTIHSDWQQYSAMRPAPKARRQTGLQRAL